MIDILRWVIPQYSHKIILLNQAHELLIREMFDNCSKEIRQLKFNSIFLEIGIFYTSYRNQM